jgi:hypothetical protein
MAGEHNFEHLPLLLRQRGPARLGRPPEQSPQTRANRDARRAHSDSLLQASRLVTEHWRQRIAGIEAQPEGARFLPQGIPILLKVGTSLDLDVLREKFAFEIVAEQEEGYVIVAAQDIDLGLFTAMVNAFSVRIRGSATVASVHELIDDPNQTDRLRRILSDRIFNDWERIDNQDIHIVDVGIACTGTQEIPRPPSRANRDSDADWARKTLEWSQARNNAYTEWDNIRVARENEILAIVGVYQAAILHMVDGAPFDSAVLPDSFTIRLRITGRGLKDFVLNYPYIFEVVEPEDISLPQREARNRPPSPETAQPTAPDADMPTVCIIDSGIQEGHVLIAPAIDRPSSHCFLPGHHPGDIGDAVRPDGHGTRVAGAVLFGENIPRNGAPQLPFWIQNARVMDQDNIMPVEMPPPEVIRSVVERFALGARGTRIFNHSINANTGCRTRYMSAWAAEVDLLCASYDILIVQSAGNLVTTGPQNSPGIRDHLVAGRDYPAFLYEPSARIANPAQSLQALTVGSIAYGSLESNGWRTFAPDQGHPSAFSRSGPGIWGVIKPEVVEYGGDSVRTRNFPVDVQAGGQIPNACPELTRSTMFAPGPAFDRDTAGTSFSAPKAARLAARIQQILPHEPALLYRALIVQSARWPEWAETILNRLRSMDPQGLDYEDQLKDRLLKQSSEIVRCIGYGLPDENRATSNTDHRTTFITSGETSIRAGDCHIYQVPIPAELRRPADDFDIRIDVTLSYVAQPRRTRRNLRRYLSTWLDWKSNRLGENLDAFRLRAMKEESEAEPAQGSALPWTLQHSTSTGFIRDTKRSNGTVQKDWAVVRSNRLPEAFCVAVVGHKGWSRDPDSTARYALVVTVEVVGREIPIYDPLRNAIIELQQLEVEASQEVELEIDLEQ